MSYLAGAYTADLKVRGMARDEVGVVQSQRPSSRNPVPSPTLLLSLMCASDPTQVTDWLCLKASYTRWAFQAETNKQKGGGGGE